MLRGRSPGTQNLTGGMRPSRPHPSSSGAVCANTRRFLALKTGHQDSIEPTLIVPNRQMGLALPRQIDRSAAGLASPLDRHGARPIGDAASPDSAQVVTAITVPERLKLDHRRAPHESVQRPLPSGSRIHHRHRDHGRLHCRIRSHLIRSHSRTLEGVQNAGSGL
jgi:hypothetical protein